MGVGKIIYIYIYIDFYLNDSLNNDLESEFDKNSRDALNHR
jgi:hypothetical protein